MIKTIFFDIGGVLLNIYPDRTIDYLAAITNLSSQQIIDYFPVEEHNKYERGEISDDEFYNAIINKLSNSNGLTAKKFWDAWGRMVGSKTDTVEIMDKLTQNYSVWLLSNTNPYHILKERRTNIFRNISGAIYSYETGYRKPEIGIFEYALEKTGNKAEQSLFIDDLEINISAARSINIDTIHYISTFDLKEKLKERRLL